MAVGAADRPRLASRRGVSGLTAFGGQNYGVWVLANLAADEENRLLIVRWHTVALDGLRRAALPTALGVPAGRIGIGCSRPIDRSARAGRVTLPDGA